jgi:DNA-binding protein
MAADEMLQLGVYVMEFVTQFADQINEVLIQLAGERFGSSHVEATCPALKRLSLEAFGGF